MIVPIKENEIVLTEEQRIQMYWDDWIFHSHRWVEEGRGYYRCDFCGNHNTSTMPIGSSKLCEKNPYINSLSEKVI